MLDWIFEGIVNWVSKTVTQLMDMVSGLFLNALGTEMTAMEEYFPFVSKAFTVLQYVSWCLLFLIIVWQLFRSFGGPITEAENPWVLLARGVIFAVLIYFAKPIFLYILNIAKAPYTALMDISMSGENFTFTGIEGALKNGLVNIVAIISVVGLLLITILMIALGWNYFKLLLEVVERYIVVGVLCYTSPLAYSMGASKNTSQVFKSWCRMVGSQLLLLIMNVWFLRAFNSSVGQYIGNGAALSNGYGTVFLWLFCAIAFLKTAQRFDTYLASMGLNVAQTGSGLGMELIMAARLVTGAGGGMRSAGNVFRGTPAGGNSTGFLSGFANRFKGNSFVRDSVVQGGVRMGAGGAVGFVGRAFGGIAAKNGASLTGTSISSVANSDPRISGKIAGDIADRSLSNYMPHLKGKKLAGTEISGGKISTNVSGQNGNVGLNFYNASQYNKPNGPYSTVKGSDGSTWYQTASGADASSYFSSPKFTGNIGERNYVSSVFPGLADGTTLRTVNDGIIEATTQNGNSLWYNSAFYEEPDAPHTVITSADGLDYYAMESSGVIPKFESGTDANEYNSALFSSFMPGYEQSVSSVDASGADDGRFEIRHDDGSGTMFYDSSMYNEPRGNYTSYEDNNGHTWFGVNGDASVERRPVYENGEPIYDGDSVRTISVPTVKYNSTPSRYSEPQKRDLSHESAPRHKE